MGGNNHATMHDAMQRIEAAHQRIHALQARLEGQLRTLPASPELQHGHRRFDSELEKVKAGLDDVHHRLAASVRVGCDTPQECNA